MLRELTPGAYAARNTGIRAARAPIIAFTDADCRVDPNWLSSILEHMADPEIAMLVGHCRFPPQASMALHLLGAYENAKTEFVINRCESTQQFAYGNNMAVRASVFEEIGLFKEWKRAGDSELVHRLAAQRPDLRLAFCRTVRIEHLEFLSARARMRRLLLYAKTNARIGTFKELSLGKRLGVLLQLLRLLG